MEQNELLKHVGVKGMRWGKRKGGGSESADSRSAKKIKRSRLKTLSNKELESLNKRMRLEKDFKKHTKKDYSQAIKVLGGILKVIGSIRVANVVARNAPNAIKQLTAPAAVVIKTLN